MKEKKGGAGDGRIRTYVPRLLLCREKSSKTMELPGGGRFWNMLFCSLLRPARVAKAMIGSNEPKS
jgi:hypothetical protein